MAREEEAEGSAPADWLKLYFSLMFFLGSPVGSARSLLSYSEISAPFPFQLALFSSSTAPLERVIE